MAPALTELAFHGDERLRPHGDGCHGAEKSRGRDTGARVSRGCHFPRGGRAGGEGRGHTAGRRETHEDPEVGLCLECLRSRGQWCDRHGESRERGRQHRRFPGGLGVAQARGTRQRTDRHLRCTLGGLTGWAENDDKQVNREPKVPGPAKGPTGNNQGATMGSGGCRGDSFRQGSGQEGLQGRPSKQRAERSVCQCSGHP